MCRSSFLRRGHAWPSGTVSVRDGPVLEFSVSLMPLEVLEERGSRQGVMEEPFSHFSP